MNAGIPDVVGANVRQLRLWHGWTLDALTQEMRTYGFNWSTGRLGDIEAGRGAVRLETLAGLALALRVSVPDLLATKGGLALNDTLTLTSAQWADLLAGRQAAVALPSQTARLPLADIRAISRLEVSHTEYLMACMDLWGSLMSEEVEALAGESSPQRRGHLTRRLQRQIHEYLSLTADAIGTAAAPS